MSEPDYKTPVVQTLPTGIPDLDEATGGGYPVGRVVEVFGDEPRATLGLVLPAIAACQKAGHTCCVVDVDRTFRTGWAEKRGVDVENLIFSRPDRLAIALETVENIVASGAVDLLVINSVAASSLDEAAELTGVNARMMSRALRKITSVAARHGICVIFLNQSRRQPGVTFGSDTATFGGNALRFYSSLRLHVRYNDVRIVKNKFAPPFRTVQFGGLEAGE